MNNLKTERNKLYGELKGYGEIAKTRALTDEEQAAFDSLLAKIDGLDQRLSTLEQVESQEEAEASTRVEDEEEENSVNNTVESRGRKSELTFAVHDGDKKHSYSLMRAVRGALNGKIDGYEAEVTQEAVNKGFSFRNGGQVFVPFRGRVEDMETRTDLDTTSGTGLIPTIFDKDVIEYLRNKMVVAKLGAKQLTGLQGDFWLPRQATTSTLAFVAEGGSATASTATFDGIKLVPRTATCNTTITRSMLLQAFTPDLEALIKEDHLLNVANGIDNIVINGRGATTYNEPTGIVNTTGVNTDSGAGNAPTYAQMVGLRQKVAAANVPLDSFAYVTSPPGKTTLETTPKIGTTYPVFLCENEKMAGYPVVDTNQISTTVSVSGVVGNQTLLIGGSWDQVVIGHFGPGYELLVDPFSNSLTGAIRLVSFHSIDVAVRHNRAFSVMDLKMS